MSVRDNVEPTDVMNRQRMNRMFKKTFQQGRNEQSGKASVLSYIETLGNVTCLVKPLRQGGERSWKNFPTSC